MKAVILVGGEGTRLRPLTYDIPKPMVPIVNKPYMEHQIDYLMRHGFNELIFALGYKSDALENFFADGSKWGARFWHVVEKEPLGTAGAVKNVEHFLDDTFLVFNGDVLSTIDLTALVRLHRERGAVGTIALTPVEDPSHYGVVVTDSDGRVGAFIEKPPRDQVPSNAINAGVYVLEPSVVAGMPPGRRWMFETEVFPGLLKAQQPLYAVASDAYWIDIGNPQRYLQAAWDVLEGRAGVSLPTPCAGGPQWRGSGVEVEAGARVEGAVWFGDGVHVERGAHIVGPTALGAGCRVAEGAVIRRSNVWDNTRIESGAVLDGALVGRDSVVGRGARIELEAVLGSHQTLAPGAHLESRCKVPV